MRSVHLTVKMRSVHSHSSDITTLRLEWRRLWRYCAWPAAAEGSTSLSRSQPAGSQTKRSSSDLAGTTSLREWCDYPELDFEACLAVWLGRWSKSRYAWLHQTDATKIELVALDSWVKIRWKFSQSKFLTSHDWASQLPSSTTFYFLLSKTKPYLHI